MKHHIHRLKKYSKRILTAVTGGAVVIIGAVLIPYPGPGWLIVFAGFAILATEFEFAEKTLDWLKEKYEVWAKWLRRQHAVVQLAVLALTGLVVLTTVWLLNGFGMLNSFFNLNYDWVISPLFR